MILWGGLTSPENLNSNSPSIIITVNKKPPVLIIIFIPEDVRPPTPPSRCHLAELHLSQSFSPDVPLPFISPLLPPPRLMDGLPESVRRLSTSGASTGEPGPRGGLPQVSARVRLLPLGGAESLEAERRAGGQYVSRRLLFWFSATVRSRQEMHRV